MTSKFNWFLSSHTTILQNSIPFHLIGFTDFFIHMVNEFGYPPALFYTRDLSGKVN